MNLELCCCFLSGFEVGLPGKEGSSSMASQVVSSSMHCFIFPYSLPPFGLQMSLHF